MCKILSRLVGIWPCCGKNASACFLEHSKFRWFSVIHVSQGSVATYVRCGGMSTQRCIANFLLSLSVKEFLKSVKIDKVTAKSLVASFFGTVYTNG